MDFRVACALVEEASKIGLPAKPHFGNSYCGVNRDKADFGVVLEEVAGVIVLDFGSGLRIPNRSIGQRHWATR